MTGTGSAIVRRSEMLGFAGVPGCMFAEGTAVGGTAQASLRVDGTDREGVLAVPYRTTGCLVDVPADQAPRRLEDRRRERAGPIMLGKIPPLLESLAAAAACGSEHAGQ